MRIFRHPKTQNERKADQAVLHEDSLEKAKIHARVRTGAKGLGLPTERDDKYPAARSDRARGKRGYSQARKAKARERHR